MQDSTGPGPGRTAAHIDYNPSKPEVRVAFSLVQMLGPKLPMIDIVDVGAMELDGEKPGYMSLVESGVGRLVGFEPNPVECNKLNASNAGNCRYLPYFVGDGRAATFHLCKAPMTSSIYEPNLELLSKFNLLADLTTPVSRIPCQTRRLDDITEIAAIDVLKVDVQGAERDVLRGGEQRLKDTVLIVTEVEFVPLYRGQPLFADVDAEMRRQGFCLHLLGTPASMAFRPFTPNGDPWKGIRQALWVDVAYVKDFTRFGDLRPDQLIKLAAVLHDLFGSFDLAALAIQHYDAKVGDDLWHQYVRALGGEGLQPPPL
jgi:FkbM family methyltransferase